MSVNLLDLVKGQLSNSVIGAISGALGESTERTQSAIDGVAPALLGGLMKKASTTSGADALFDMIKDNDGSVLNDLGNLFNANNLQDTLTGGAKTIGNLFGGGGLQSIIETLTRSSGLGGKSLTSLFSMLAPVVMGVLGKQTRASGLDAAGLAGLLMNQGSFLKKSLPATLFSSMGLGNIGDMAGKLMDGAGSAISGAAGAATGAASAATGAASAAASRTIDGGKAAIEKGGSGLKKILPIALLALLAIVAWPFLRNMGERAGDVAGAAADAAGDVAGAAADAAGDVAGAAADAAGAAVDAAGNAVEGAGNMVEGAANWVASAFDYANAPSFGDLGLPEGSTLANFITFLKTGTDASRTFTLENVKFETGSAVLQSVSQSQLDNVVKVLMAYDKINVELQGHTDNTGNADSNVALSEARANSVRQYLIDKGVAGERLTAVGFGSAQPIASNDTAEGRQQNRRTDIRVTQK